MSNIIGTLISFTKHSGEEQITVLELGDNISETELMFSWSRLTFYSTTRFWYDDARKEAIFTLQQLGKLIYMTKVE